MDRRREDDDAPPPGLSPEDAHAWAEEVAGVRPLPPAPRVVQPARAPATATPRASDATPAGAEPWDIEDDGTRHQGRAPGVAGRLLRRLARGEFPVEARCDLHGMTRAEADAALERFLREALAAGRRTVLVIHGRGAHAPDGRAVLRAFVRDWLSASARRGSVLAFSSAPPRLGGPGATLVRLRRRR